jgi:tetratricopeptide (TPR) repeat protein
VDALALPLGAVPDSPTPQRPPDGGAYALYLRANELARDFGTLTRARELYEQCLRLDPAFAPGWAQLGRCRRVINKFVDGSADRTAEAEEAFRRALEINPRLTLAHKYYAHLEAETGHPRAALARLLGEATRHGNDPELFAGLVHACRYCGLFEQSLAAHEEARRLDPNVASSVEETMLMNGDLERLVAIERPAPTPIQVIGLGLLERRDEARRVLAELRQQVQIPIFATYTEALLGWLDRRPAEQMWSGTGMKGLRIFDDPEAIFQEGWLLCEAGAPEPGLPLLLRAVAKGYAVAATLARSPAFDALRGEPAFRELLARAEADREEALRTFRENAGEKLLGR